MTFLPIYFYLIVVSFCVSLLVYKDSRYPYLKLFPPFLFATIIAEFTAAYLSNIAEHNVYIYNFFSIIEFCFYIYLVGSIVTSKMAKKIILTNGVFYFFLAISNVLFFQGMKTFHTVTYSFGCLIIVAVCIYYFLELFRLPKSVKLSQNPAFWICSGLLFFYCCGFPLYAFLNFWSRFKWIIQGFGEIFNILNMFLYSLFTIAFLCNRTRKYTSLLS